MKQMKLDLSLWVKELAHVPAAARAAEEMGFHGLWTSDVAHNPLFPLVLAAEHTRRVELGTSILVAFARSPMDVAYQAWDLAQYSQGRLRLGLGTQVQAHIERRFGMTWRTPVVDHLREYVAALRAIWRAWQRGERLNFRGDFYRLTLMTPFFTPEPVAHPQIPIYTAGVNEQMCRLAGEVSDGFHAHPFHSRRYLAEVVLPGIEAGARAAGRSRADVEVSSAIFVVIGDTPAEIEPQLADVRRQIAFYASTPSYAAVMELHGWGGVQHELSRLAARRRWDEMPSRITDEMLETFALICSSATWAERVREKYTGLLDRVTLYVPFDGSNLAWWRTIAASWGLGQGTV